MLINYRLQVESYTIDMINKSEFRKKKVWNLYFILKEKG